MPGPVLTPLLTPSWAPLWAPLVPMHGIGGRQDLPIPFNLVVLGAMVAVLASFVVLSLTWGSSRLKRARFEIVLPRLTRVVDSPWLTWAVRGFGLAMTAWATWALLGGQDTLSNPIFGFVYVWVWIGLVPVSLLFGPVWPLLNPLRSLHLLICRLVRINPDRGELTLPYRIGTWPAAAGLFGFVYLELVEPDRATIPVLLLAASVYLTVLGSGAVVFGRSWFAAADPFEAYAQLIAQLSPWGRNSAGTVVFRLPLSNLATFIPPRGTVAFVAILIGSTAYDGLSNSTFWIRWIQAQPFSQIAAASFSLVATTSLTAAVFVAATRLGGYLVRSPLAGQPRLFIHALVPIALGYVTAHYLTLFVFEGQHTVALWSDPLSRGWNVFGTATWDISYALAAYPAVIATVQAGAVVLGHIGAVFVAHDRSLEVTAHGRAALSQAPMVVAMVGYTAAALLLLFAQ